MGLHLLGKTKIAQLDRVVASKEDVLGLQVSVENSDLSLLSLETGCFGLWSQNIGSNLSGIVAIMAAEKGGHELRQNTPNELLLRIFVNLLKVLDDHAQISTTAVFHVQIQILAGLEVFAMVVSDDVRVSEGA